MARHDTRKSAAFRRALRLTPLTPPFTIDLGVLLDDREIAEQPRLIAAEGQHRGAQPCWTRSGDRCLPIRSNPVEANAGRRYGTRYICAHPATTQLHRGNTVAAGLLGNIERLVGAAHDVVGVRISLLHLGHTDA